MRKVLLFVLAFMMAASLSVGVAFAATGNGFDENGWYQNANMDTITINDEGASVLNFTSGSIVSYNRTELDLTKVNYFYAKTTPTNWALFHLFDDVSEVPDSSVQLYPAGSSPAYVKVSMLMGSGGMQLGNGYAPNNVIGIKQGKPADLTSYFKVEIYIGEGGEDKSYIKLDDVEVIGEHDETLNVTRSDFRYGKRYVAWLSADANLSVAGTDNN